MIAVDTSAIFALLAQEPEYVQIGRRMEGEDLVMASPSWVETGIVVSRKLGANALDRLQRFAFRMRMEIAIFDRSMADEAVRAHLRYGRGSGHPARLNLGDCFSYALAKSRDLPLLFKGDDFAQTDIRSALKPV